MDGKAKTARPGVIATDHGALRLLRFNEPERRNPLSSATLAALSSELARAADDDSVRALILHAEGPAFSAGHDLREIRAARNGPDRGRAFFEQLMAECAGVMLAIRDLPKPVIAAVEGIATAAGCQLVATCDLAIAGAGAHFATPGVHIGLFCSTPMVALTRNVAAKHAMGMLLTGDPIDAETAARFGLVNRVVPAGQALAAALKLGETVAARPPVTLAIGKEAFYRQREMELDAAYAYASRVMVENLLHREAVEGIEAFVARPKG